MNRGLYLRLAVITDNTVTVIPDKDIPDQFILGSVRVFDTMYIPEYFIWENNIADPVFEDTADCVEKITYDTFGLLASIPHPVELCKNGRFFYISEQKLSRNAIRGTVGEIIFGITYRNGTTVNVKVRILPSCEEDFTAMIDDLKKISHKLLLNSFSPVRIQTDHPDFRQNPADLEQNNNKTAKKHITDPESTKKYLSGFESLLETLQIHAETDLKSSYEKTAVRKVKHFTPRTIMEINRGNAKVSAVTHTETYNIYEHRAIRNFLNQIGSEIQFQIRSIENDIRLQESLRTLNKNNLQFQKEIISCYMNTYRVGSEKSFDAFDAKENIEQFSSLHKSWTECLEYLQSIIDKFDILQVPETNEPFHSSMLFMRNRYYRPIYEHMKNYMLIKTYTSYNHMPVEKLWTLYEYWCFFKLLSILTEVYGFKILSHKSVQEEMPEDKFDEVVESATEELGEQLQSYISPSDFYAEIDRNANMKYIGIILQKTWTPVKRVYRKNEEGEIITEHPVSRKVNNAFIKLEYQRRFYNDEGKTDIIPDICLTTAMKIKGTVKKQLYIFDAKYKRFKSNTSDAYTAELHWVHQMFFVSWYKYFSYFRDKKTKEIMMGSFILFPENFGRPEEFANPDTVGYHREYDYCTKDFPGTYRYRNCIRRSFYNKHSEEYAKIATEFPARIKKNIQEKGLYYLLNKADFLTFHGELEQSNGKYVIRSGGGYAYDIFSDPPQLWQYYLAFPYYGFVNEYYGLSLADLYREYTSPENDSKLYGFEIKERKQVLDKIEEIIQEKKKSLKSDSPEKEDDKINSGEYYLNSLENKLGFFYTTPHDELGIKALLRMILELNRPFGFDNENYPEETGRDERLPILWNNCKLCGAEIKDNNIISGYTQSGYLQYVIKCDKCGDVWNKTHCSKAACGNPLIIRHNYLHNYLRMKNSANYVLCPLCGQ